MTQTAIEVEPTRGLAAPTDPPKPRTPFRLPRFSWTIVVSTLSVVLGLVAWELIARYWVHNTLFLTGPIDIVKRFGPMFTQEHLLHHISVSSQEFGLGMALSISIGVPVGLAMALVPAVKAVLQPWISALYATPTIALSPLFILWFGLGLTGKVVVVTLIAVFPIIVNTESGVRDTSHDLIEMSRVLGLSGLGLFSRIHLRSALPYVLSGIRLSIGKAIIGVVVGELFGGRAGLGVEIQNTTAGFDTAGLFVCVAILAVGGVVLSGLVQFLENRSAPWRQQ